MKRILVTLLILGLLSSCRRGGGTARLALGEAPWREGEKAVYDVVDRSGNRAGSAEFAIAGQGEAWVLTQVEKIGQLDQTATVRIDARTLEPLGEEKTIRAPGTDATVTTTYQGGKLEIKALVKGEEKAATIDVPAGALDNDQLLMTLRALSFAQGYQGQVLVIVAQNALKISGTIRVQGQEAVTVPAGTLQAWKVELEFAQARQYAWYEVASPHRLVQYDNGSLKYQLQK